MQRGVFGMSALIENRRIGLFAGKNCYQDIRLGVVLAEVSTESTLSVRNLHIMPPCRAFYETTADTMKLPVELIHTH